MLSFCYIFLLEAGYSEKVHDSRARVCLSVATEAVEQGVDPMLAAAVAHVESGFRKTAQSSAGAVGPMQVITKFWCKNKKCDLIKAGVKALDTYVSKYGEREGLCRYVSGRACEDNLTRRKYRDKVLDVRIEMNSIHKSLCVEGC